ncbi:MarR family winged helix-turn-helix transcriptional regulator [Palleronia sp. LCG004]|uniref:MarR family winged helix-turn-helix transcriptional regulator n=1 Tax=Palleronia sp. LCG004 TaxID=3079304 RepID=UPI002942EEE7|nr:MarR family transcriptional regulator [Palleronia sp. LCG004]WOI56432.1 MarR family transcriptional regulator [Palleronia sp. LCG004]
MAGDKVATRSIMHEAEDLELGALGGSVGFLVRLAQLEIFEMFYEAEGLEGVRPGEFSILYLASINPGARQGALARRLRIKRAHMAKLVTGLEARDLLRREVPEGDRRALRIFLTEGGARFVEERAPAFLDQTRRETARLSTDEAATLVALLHKFTGIRP